MLCKNPVENEERKNNRHTVCVDTYDQSEIIKCSLEEYYRLKREDEQSDEILQKKRERSQDLQMALEMLSKRQYDVLILCAVHGYKQAQVGIILGIRQQVVSRHYKAAIRKMQKLLVK